jgi:putative nucleotidyltransferase with HDIG domain
MIKNIPSITQCLELHDRYAMLGNIRAHSSVVARVAESLVDGLERAGKTPGPLPDREEAVVGALLHDIAKTLCIKTGCRHAEIGQQICLELGYPELSEIVAEHVILKDFRADLYARGIFGAKEIVFYADKRVCHDQVVSLEGRLEYILGRYGDHNPAKEYLIHQNFKQTLDFEKYLFGFLDFLPTEIARHISSAQFSISR